ncbi:4-oxalocrotonate tautomerase [Sinorhizobium meliloti]|uniref:tautomerase family protein n=1 Tax=Rhizobium meliloti TaxID=382 RepID=UPI000FDC0697|nr:tautomerase family protein [Sinorhizobium meliloti]RVH60096.1 4-oxalocrotonate tautomerase [Sinorhizobium meliloti]
MAEGGAQKRQLAEAITKNVMDILNYGAESVSVGFLEVPAKDWADQVYRPDIQKKPEILCKKPGYTM